MKNLRLVVVALLIASASAQSATALPQLCKTPEEQAADLIAAIEAANDEATNPGVDTIHLATGCLYTFNQNYGASDYALPTIASAVIIRGHGARIDPAHAGAIGFAEVTGSLTMSNVTLLEFDGLGAASYINTLGWGSTILADTIITNVPPTGQQTVALRVLGSDATLAMIDSVIENQVDQNDGSGGAIDNDGHLVLTRTTLNGNVVAQLTPPGPGGVGGAIANGGTAEIFESSFTANRAGASGGAIINSGDLKIYDSTFVGNSANFGGAISNSADLLVEDSYLEGNRALGGGAIDTGTASATSIARILNSTFYDNYARAGTGGALRNSDAARVEHSTFSANTASTGGNSLSSPSGLIGVEASIVDGDSPCAGSFADFGGNLVFPLPGGCPAGFTLGDPVLLGPALNGGVTNTMSLGAGSAAIDLAGACTNPTVDQRGLARPAGPGCDAGAFEDQLPSTPGTPFVTAGGTKNNTGQFSLGWNPATDPDDTPGYRLSHKDADDAEYTPVGGSSLSAPSHSFGPADAEAEGTFTYVVEASDGNHTSPISPESAPVVVDKTAPSAPKPVIDGVPAYRPPGGMAWYRDRAEVLFKSSNDPALADGSPGSGFKGSDDTPPPQIFTTSGLHHASATVTDLAGNQSMAGEIDVQVDADPPSVSFSSCPASVLLGSSHSLGWTASDAHSGLATASTGTVAIDTSSVGLKTLTTPPAEDNVGHTATAECQVRVIYDFHGFFTPVKNAPDVNDAQAGAQIRISFDLSGDRGLSVFPAGFPVSGEVACDAPGELTTGTSTESSRGLTFTPGGRGRYAYLWDTQPGWAGTCRQLVVQLDDGTFHRANFDFR